MPRFSIAIALVLAMLSAPAVAQVSTGQIAVTPNAAAYVSGYCLGGVLAVPNLVRFEVRDGSQNK
jgi:hypothetical protein